MIDIVGLLAEDRQLITYRPRLNKITGSVTATIFLQQVLYRWTANGRQPFYKFNDECEHEKYREGDSWTEELGFTIYELRGARDKVATKITRGKSRDAVLASEDPAAMILYWTDKDRLTWYEVNPDLVTKLFFQIYIAKLEKPIYIGKEEKSTYLERGDSAVIYSSQRDLKENNKEKSFSASLPEEIPISPTDSTPVMVPPETRHNTIEVMNNQAVRRAERQRNGQSPYTRNPGLADLNRQLPIAERKPLVDLLVEGCGLGGRIDGPYGDDSLLDQAHRAAIQLYGMGYRPGTLKNGIAHCRDHHWKAESAQKRNVAFVPSLGDLIEHLDQQKAILLSSTASTVSGPVVARRVGKPMPWERNHKTATTTEKGTDE